MFGYRIDGQWADLLPGQTVKLSRYNNLFDFEYIRGSLVNDFALPFTPKNDRLFGWYREDKMRYQNREYYCEVVADGYIIERGYIALADIQENQYIVVFTQNLSDFFGQWQTESLKKLPLGSAVITPAKNPNHLTADICWPTVSNTAFYGTNVLAGYAGMMNEWEGSVLNSVARVPMLFLRFLFDRITDITGVSFSGTFFESEVFRRAVVFNVHSLDEQTEIIYSNHLPDMSLIDALKELKRLFNLVVVLDVYRKQVRVSFAEDVLRRKATLDWSRKVVPTSSRTPDMYNRLKLESELDGNDNIMKEVPLPEGFDPYVTPETQRGQLWEMKSRWGTITCDPDARVEQVGVSVNFNQKGASFSPRLALWGGVVEDRPAITSKHSGWNLNWAGDNNLYEKCWKAWEAAKIGTGTKIIMANLNALDLYHIDWNTNPDAYHAIIIRGKEYYVVSVETLLPLQGVSQVILMEKNI